MFGALLQRFLIHIINIVTFIDNYSHFTWVYFLHSKTDVLKAFKIFLAYVENQFSSCIITLWPDLGGEYFSSDLQNFLQQKGILSHRTGSYTL